MLASITRALHDRRVVPYPETARRASNRTLVQPYRRKPLGARANRSARRCHRSGENLFRQSRRDPDRSPPPSPITRRTLGRRAWSELDRRLVHVVCPDRKGSFVATRSLRRRCGRAVRWRCLDVRADTRRSRCSRRARALHPGARDGRRRAHASRLQPRRRGSSGRARTRSRREPSTNTSRGCRASQRPTRRPGSGSAASRSSTSPATRRSERSCSTIRTRTSSTTCRCSRRTASGRSSTRSSYVELKKK